MAVINAANNLTVALDDTAPWRFAFSKPPAVEVAQLLTAIRRTEVDAQGVVRLPWSFLAEIEVEQSARPRVIIWGDSIVTVLDERDVRSLDPSPEAEAPGSWDWTGGLREDHLYTATGLKHSIIGFSPLDDYSQGEIASITRRLERLEGIAYQVFAERCSDADYHGEVARSLEMIRSELRRPRPWRNTIRLAVAFAVGVLSSLVGTAAWEALREPVADLVRAVR